MREVLVLAGFWWDGLVSAGFGSFQVVSAGFGSFRFLVITFEMLLIQDPISAQSFILMPGRVVACDKISKKQVIFKIFIKLSHIF